ncbi:Aste57867_12933 [Aphanomyces stellatus]|uniref:Aste57867_12933 protein n=1 Tax=Aphanomyces stellatus TaxID=120398 RepID=A0A485KXB7_9STRA|nr:hypothetical protein As57867_012885 [Aphanomyces stellatus]VFT89779.1 Aste57867_12933 [Aphanomyces stellatus]
MVDSSHFVCECDVTSPEDLKLHGANCSLAILKCPWQWREPFLDERRNKLKRKLGDVSWRDPVDPEFIDHLVPGAGKKLFRDVESDELSKIHSEIQRLNHAKATSAQHVSSWDEEDIVDSVQHPANQVPKGCESPNTVAAPMCSSEDLAYLDSILVPMVVEQADDTMERDNVVVLHAEAALEEPLLHLLSDRYETYLTYDDEELSIGETSDQGGLSP